MSNGEKKASHSCLLVITRIRSHISDVFTMEHMCHFSPCKWRWQICFVSWLLHHTIFSRNKTQMVSSLCAGLEKYYAINFICSEATEIYVVGERDFIGTLRSLQYSIPWHIVSKWCLWNPILMRMYLLSKT